MRVLLVALVATLVLVGCSSLPTVEQSWSQLSSSRIPKVTEGLKKDGTLTVSVRLDAGAPYISESNSEIEGLDVDLASALADEMGLAVNFKSVTNVPDALANTCDIVMNVTPSEASGFDVLGDYAQNATVFFHKGESTVVGVDNLNGKKVALQEGSAAQMELHLTSLQMTEQADTSLGDAFGFLSVGSADYVLCSSSAGAYLALPREGITFAGALPTPSSQGIALASGDGTVQKAVRDAFDAISKNGVLKAIRSGWLGDFPTLTAESVIPNVPKRETSGEALQSTTLSSENLGLAMDGSTAGANAVTLADVANSSTNSESSDNNGSASYTYGGGYTTDYGGGGYYTESYEY